MAEQIDAKSGFNLRILVCGQPGVGKSSLINSLFGVEVCKVVDPGSKISYGSFAPCTTKIQKAEIVINGILVTVYDSPGLQDGTANEEQYLQDMYDKCNDVDLVIYCIPMTITRYDEAEIQATKLLTAKFSCEFWKRCVLVMTKANCVKRVPTRAQSDISYHQTLYKNILNKFSSQLIKQAVPPDIAKSIPAVAAGLCHPAGGPQDERYIWYVTNRCRIKNERADFLAELWITLYETASRHSTASRSKFVYATAHGGQRVQALDQESDEANTLKELLDKEIKLLQDNSDYAEEMVGRNKGASIKDSFLAPVIRLDNEQIGRLNGTTNNSSDNKQINRSSRTSMRREIIISVSIAIAVILGIFILVITVIISTHKL